jgi:hypothetical protein
MTRTLWIWWIALVATTGAGGQVLSLSVGGVMLSDVIVEATQRHPILILLAGMLVGWAATHFWGAPR